MTPVPFADRLCAMSEDSSANEFPIAAAVPTPVTVPKPRLTVGANAQDWRRTRIAIAAFFVLAAIGFVLTMVPTYLNHLPTANDMLGGKLNTGKVISYTGAENECRQQIFDNETGQMTKPLPCDMNTLDNNSAPASSNPTNRLEAISKAFSGR